MKIIKLLFFIALLYTALNCSNKKVLLPIIRENGIEEVYNHSSIWIFFEAKNQDTIAVLNENNRIINTHWIYNIDKRLPMKVVFPLLQKMQKTKNKDSMHKKEGMLNYFSYTDYSSKGIALILFSPTIYIQTLSEYKKMKNKNQIIELEIQTENILLNSHRIEKKQLVPEISKIISTDTLFKPKLLLKYSENLSYQNYLETKAFLSNIEIEVDTIEIVFKERNF